MNKLLLAVLLSALSIGCTSECPNVWTELGTTVGNNANNKLRAPFPGEASHRVRDTIYALDGRNFIDGRAGDDELYGGSGTDRVLGSDDEDYIVGGRGRDYLFGGPHADVIEAADGWQDEVNCGEGENDRASVDKVDIVKGCEFVNGGG